MYLRNVSKRWLVAAATLLLPLPVFAESTEGPDDDPIRDYDADAQFDNELPEPDWIPSLRLAIGVNSQTVTNGSLSTLPFVDFGGVPHEEGIRRTGNCETIATGCVTPVGSNGNNPIDGPSIGFGFEIMGPTIESLWGKPRPFVVLTYRDQLEGATAIVRDQSGPPGTALDPTPQNQGILARGSVTQQNWILAGIGAAFPLPIEGYNVKLKPSINYFRSQLEIEPKLIQPVKVSSQSTPRLSQFIKVAEENQGIAPRIELDAEIYREGPFSVGFYLSLDFLVILSGPLKHSNRVNSCFNDGEQSPRCARVDDPTNLPPEGPDGQPVYDGTNYYGTSGTLQFNFDRDRVTYQGSAGLRFSWMGMGG